MENSLEKNALDSGSTDKVAPSKRPPGFGAKVWATRRERYGPSGSSKNLQEAALKMQATRRERYGPSKMTPEALERRMSLAAEIGRKNRKDVCKNGHRRTIENTRVRMVGKYLTRACRDCERERWPKRYAASIPAGLVKAGMTNIQIGMQRWWANARAKHGDSGYSPDALERIRENGRRVGRSCRGRKLKKKTRPKWIDLKGARISVQAHDAYFWIQFKRLKAEMLAAHPDKGGTSRKFIKARAAMDKFMLAEHNWYSQYGLKTPKQEKKQSKAA